MECPLCEHCPSDFHLSADQREYWLCPQCRLIFVPPAFFIPAEQEVARYLEHENSLDNEGYVNMFQEKIDVIKQVCPGIQTTLDYGCGYAPVLKTLLTRTGYRAEGYDPNFFPGGDSQKKYDLVISTETFEHFKEPAKELARLVRRISDGGYLAAMTRFYPTKNETLCEETFGKWYYKRDPTHVAFYCEKTFSWIAEQFHLEIRHNNGNDFIILQKPS
ncbi:hypothetical protein UZ36_01600 [Candidatus Nitromaritima sp. SCGC AAA799-C22]|nr:hypothetical protein UZ36_01600 [Candidatus Nitromaritima sp. SCGC AAA799-C22]